MDINAKFLISLGVKKRYAQRYIEPLLHLTDRFDINLPLRFPHFLAQVLHESSMMKATVENFNYSTKRLLKIFPRYFKKGEAVMYARNPQMIANRVYAKRMGNKEESSGDGWKYRGRGLIMLTGFNNYEDFDKWLIPTAKDLAEVINIDVIENPDLVSRKLAVHSAIYYWDRNNINLFADQDNIRAVTKAINGGFHGLKNRTMLLSKIISQILSQMPNGGS